MRKFNLLSTCIALALTTQVVVAADYLLDASTMAVGATAGENLIVKEGCLDPTKTTCTEKYKWLTATSAIKIGNLQVVGELKGNFEIIVILDAGGDPKGINLLTTDNKGISLSDKSGSNWVLDTNGIGTGAAWGSDGWKSGYEFNELKLTVQQGTIESTVKAYINGVPLPDGLYGAVKFDKDQAFSRVAFEGFTTNDRQVEVQPRQRQFLEQQTRVIYRKLLQI